MPGFKCYFFINPQLFFGKATCIALMLLIAKAAEYFFFFYELFLKKDEPIISLLSLSSFLAAAIIRQKHDASFPTIYRQGHGRRKRKKIREARVF